MKNTTKIIIAWELSERGLTNTDIAKYLQRLHQKHNQQIRSKKAIEGKLVKGTSFGYFQYFGNRSIMEVL